MSASSHKPAPVKSAPTLYVIIFMKLAKGLFFAGLALTAYVLSDNNLPQEYKSFLLEMKHYTHLDPERRFWVDLAGKINAVTEAGMLRAALGIFLYSLFALVEGIGLIFRVTWIGWMTIGESAFFIPIEIAELMHDFTWIVFAILVLNIFMLWYLFQNRQRLFKH
ncbi:MAG TPA: DUF2127 domain-containing protein [Verrucomicrobiae bacterium]|jgi:uncharacterized membrane protein (DUF2068 family)|nr:DUF2127 domain-containing protein [Verrucomicrobiae bacterium]